MMKAILTLVFCFAICSCAPSVSRNSQKLSRSIQSNNYPLGACTNLIVDIDEHGATSVGGLHVSKRKIVKLLSGLGSAEEPAGVIINVRRASPHDSVMTVYDAVHDVAWKVVFQRANPAEWQSPLPHDKEATTNSIDEELFIHSVKNWSTAPNYVLVTVSTPSDSEARSICLEGPQLVGAISYEQGLPFDVYGEWFATMIAISNRSRCFKFTNPEAVKSVNLSWSENVYKEVAALLSGLDRETLISLVKDRHSLLHQIYREHDDLQLGLAYGAAIANVLLRYQIPCLRGCERFEILIDEDFLRKLDTRRGD